MSDSSLTRFISQVTKELLKGQILALGYFKYFPAWKRSLDQGRTSILDELPWITFPVIDMLKKKLNRESKVFEYGGGGSTLFFIKTAKELVTVEHDQYWFNNLQSIIKEKNLPTWNAHFIPPEPKPANLKLDRSNPDDYYTDDEAFLDFQFKRYVTVIDQYPDEYFDIILIDGRSRPACIKHSLPKLKRAGLLVVDNADREYYFTRLIDLFKTHFNIVYNQKAPSPYADFFTQTGVWQKR